MRSRRFRLVLGCVLTMLGVAIIIVGNTVSLPDALLTIMGIALNPLLIGGILIIIFNWPKRGQPPSPDEQE